MQLVQWSRPAPPAPPERGSPIFGFWSHFAGDQHHGFVEQAALVQILEQRRKGTIKLGQQTVLPGS